MIAVLTDIHANYEALEEVVKDLYSFPIHTIYTLGDIVGYGPNPNECVKLVRKMKMKAIKGNHERGLTNEDFLANFNPLAAKIIQWTKQSLTAENFDYLKDLPEKIADNQISYVHGSILDSDKYILESTDVIEEIEELRRQKLLIEFFGHTHMKIVYVEEEGMVLPKEKWIGVNHSKIYLINPGSVGQPRDRDPLASYLVFDPEKKRILFRRLKYDVNKTIEKMKRENFPPFTYNRLKMGL